MKEIIKEFIKVLEVLIDTLEIFLPTIYLFIRFFISIGVLSAFMGNGMPTKSPLLFMIIGALLTFYIVYPYSRYYFDILKGRMEE